MAVVTALRARARGRVAVELDGAPWRVLPVAAAVRAGLSVGAPLDARTLIRELRRADAVAHATRALRHRDHSRRALASRLSAAGLAAEVRDEVLDSLERAAVVNDDRLARNRACALARRGYGDAAIRADLDRGGIGGEAIEAALRELEPERERAQELAARRGAGARTARWLAGRGFDDSSIEDAVGGFAAET